MNRYETLFIIKPDQTDEEIQAVIDRLVQRVESVNGKVASINHWGNRRLAYTIRYRGEALRRGYYVLFTYVGDGAAVEEVERNIKILDQTFRYLTVKVGDDVDPDSVGEVEIKRLQGSEAPPEPVVREEDESSDKSESGETAGFSEDRESSGSAESFEADKDSSDEEGEEE